MWFEYYFKENNVLFANVCFQEGVCLTRTFNLITMCVLKVCARIVKVCARVLERLHERRLIFKNRRFKAVTKERDGVRVDHGVLQHTCTRAYVHTM